MGKINLNKGKQLAILIDPDKFDSRKYSPVIEAAMRREFDFFLVGGSLTFNPVDTVVDFLQANTPLPVILFPGDMEQVYLKADGILFLSLVSGRNSEYLIGKHVLVAKRLKDSGMQVVPTGYILIGGGGKTSIEYITQTHSLPANKPQLAVATAVAAELLGMKLIYLEAGSNSISPVPAGMISAVRQNIQIPLMVGGGIKDQHKLEAAYNAGADIAVIGSALEEDPRQIDRFVSVLQKVKSQKK